jgi:hypothetical protein
MVERVKARIGLLRERWHRTLVVVRAPRVRIVVSGGDQAHAVFRGFTARHPRLPITSAKRWGVALLRVPDSSTTTLAAARRTGVGSGSTLSAGFRYQLLSPQQRLDEILEINRSAPSRQGRPMSDTYVDRDRVAREHEHDTTIHGIIDAEGRLRAYAVTRDLGEALAFSKVIGHADDLSAGIVHLLVCEIVRCCIEARGGTGRPTWIMYDTFWGASEGLAYFKDRLGFRPCTVDWVWAGEATAGPPGDVERRAPS